jgi:hypothetical protein
LADADGQQLGGSKPTRLEQLALLLRRSAARNRHHLPPFRTQGVLRPATYHCHTAHMNAGGDANSQQHGGMPARRVVRVGDRVYRPTGW